MLRGVHAHGFLLLCEGVNKREPVSHPPQGITPDRIRVHGPGDPGVARPHAPANSRLFPETPSRVLKSAASPANLPWIVRSTGACPFSMRELPQWPSRLTSPRRAPQH